MTDAPAPRADRDAWRAMAAKDLKGAAHLLLRAFLGEPPVD